MASDPRERGELAADELRWVLVNGEVRSGEWVGSVRFAFFLRIVLATMKRFEVGCALSVVAGRGLVRGGVGRRRRGE
jgi:hypothetical protein